MKNIILCSDGTGNKGGYGEDTNVYKIYKAVDIHHATKQFIFYEQGVGTDKSDNSKNKYWTALSGAFGFGFQDNIRNLYNFLARSYETGDPIFLFGFSRGAATVRAFAGLINACGLIDKNHTAVQTDGFFDEEKFRKLVDEAFKCYQGTQQAKDKFKQQYAIKNDKHAPDGNLKIKFIGVWDTVSALGFPKDFSVVVEKFFNLADAISDKLWPHHFYDYELNPCIENAYHALSIDDERTTFHPMVWDESKSHGYVEQVWFAGVHSNVGGGYPRTGLSDVALQWMIAKAQAHGLIFCTDLKTQIEESANVYDKLYDSRDGVAIYYRYGPRNLEQLCQGKLKDNIAIHETAYKKMDKITDAYAPDGLPSQFNLVDIDPKKPQHSQTLRTITAPPTNWNTLKLQMAKLIASREVLYRVFVELTMLILVVSGLLWACPPESVTTASSSGIFANLADILKYFTPVYFENFIVYVVAVHSWIFLIMLGILYYMTCLRKRLVNNLDEVCRKMCDLL